MDRQTAISLLIDNIRHQDYHPEDHYHNVVATDGKYLGPYIPYIGKSYFTTEPRVLIYGMAQNLCKDESADLIRSWLSRNDKGMRRLDYGAHCMGMLLWDSGNLKVLAALALKSCSQTSFKVTDDVSHLVAVTNLVKFSFWRERNGKLLDQHPPKEIYDVMWKLYCGSEVEVLQPQIIVGCGRAVTEAMRKNLAAGDCADIRLVGIVFPYGRPLAKYIHDGRLLEEKGYDSMKDIAEIQDLMKGTPDEDDKIRTTIRRNWNYLREMRGRFAQACSLTIS